MILRVAAIISASVIGIGVFAVPRAISRLRWNCTIQAINSSANITIEGPFAGSVCDDATKSSSASTSADFSFMDAKPSGAVICRRSLDNHFGATYTIRDSGHFAGQELCRQGISS